MMGWLMDSVKDLLQGIPAASILRERLLLAEDRFKDLEAENQKLQQRIAALARENEDLKRQLINVPVATALPKEQPKEMYGCYYFGNDTSKLYCPRCWQKDGTRGPMVRASSLGLNCSVCGNIVYTR
jgi:hypothetical protein